MTDATACSFSFLGGFTPAVQTFHRRDKIGSHSAWLAGINSGARRRDDEERIRLFMGTRNPLPYYTPRTPFGGAPVGSPWRSGSLQRSPSGVILKPLTARDLGGLALPKSPTRSPGFGKSPVVLRPVASASDLGGSPLAGRSQHTALRSFRPELAHLYSLERSPSRATTFFGGNEPFNPSFYPGRSMGFSTRG
jgi:hypothetical protein